MTRAILLDIEGTTTPVDFVHRTLFPYAKKRVAKYVEKHFGKLTEEISQLVEESSHDATYTIPVDPTEPGSVAAYLEYLIDVDRKSTPLKAIQGNIWEEGYASGDLRSVVFAEVPAAFRRWNAAGKVIAIYSSGSVLAQQQLFRHTDHGDLSQYIANYFDTNTGPKRASDSYGAIVSELGLSPGNVLFLSDVAEELDAASNAGMDTVHVVRDGHAAGQTQHRVVSDLNAVD